MLHSGGPAREMKSRCRDRQKEMGEPGMSMNPEQKLPHALNVCIPRHWCCIPSATSGRVGNPMHEELTSFLNLLTVIKMVHNWADDAHTGDG